MLTIFISFLVCFLPLMLVNVVDDDVAFPAVHIIASVLAWMSATINPFIYAFKNRQYQQVLSSSSSFCSPFSPSSSKTSTPTCATFLLSKDNLFQAFKKLLCVDKSRTRGGQRTTTSQVCNPPSHYHHVYCHHVSTSS